MMGELAALRRLSHPNWGLRRAQHGRQLTPFCCGNGVALIVLVRVPKSIRWPSLPTALKRLPKGPVPQVDHETDVEKWFIDRHRSKKSVPKATVVGSFT